MPRSFTLFAALVLWQCTVQIEARVSTVILGQGRLQCEIALGGYDFDLCPLMASQVHVDDSSSVSLSTSGGSDGRIPRRRGSLDVSSLTCDDNTWICLPENAKASTFVRATEISLTMSETDYTALYLRIYENNALKMVVDLYCQEVESFTRHPDDNDMSRFVWTTRHACPKSPREVYISEERPVEGDNKKDKEDENKGDNDLIPPGNAKRTRKLIALGAVLSLIIAGSYILFSSPKTRIYTIERFKSVSYALSPLISSAALKLRPVGSTVKGIAAKSTAATRRIGTRFRQDDRSLVRWAQEDFALADAEDVMVNGSGAYSPNGEWEGDGLDEFIPLNIDPRHGRNRSVRSYGSTPDVATFAERRHNLIAGIGGYFKK